MNDLLQAIIHKAPVSGLRVNVARAGLCIGDPATLQLIADGRIEIHALARHRFLGLIARRRSTHLGDLGPAAAEIVTPALQHGDHLRVRIVGLTPEHLSGHDGPEVHISVWGDIRHLQSAHVRPASPPENAASNWDAPI